MRTSNDPLYLPAFSCLFRALSAGRIDKSRETKRSLPIRGSTNPSTTEFTKESRARPTLHAAFLLLDQSVLYSDKFTVWPCCALPEEDYSEGIVSERVLSVGISVQSGETSSCTRWYQPSQKPPIVQILRSSLLRLARTVKLRQDRPRKITWRRHWRPGK